MDTREDHGSYYPGGEKVIPIREVSGNVKKVNGIAPDAAGNVQVPTDDTDAVRFTAQSLTDAQKAQARSNIGAIESAPVASVNNKTGAVTLTASDVGAGSSSDVASAVATAQGAAMNARNAALEIASHKGKTDNPHSVTAAQVGALPLSGGTLTDELTIANGGGSTSYGIGYIRGNGNDTVFELPPDDGERKTLATTDQIPTVDTTLSTTSSNPLANSAVAASLPYAVISGYLPVVTNPTYETGCYEIKDRTISSIQLTDTPSSEDFDVEVLWIRSNPENKKSFDALIEIKCASSYTGNCVMIADDGESIGYTTMILEGSLQWADMESGKRYIMAITTIADSALGIKIMNFPTENL